MILFRTKRSRQIESGLNNIFSQESATELSRLMVADWLKDMLDDQSISITLESAYHKVCKYIKKHGKKGISHENHMQTTGS